MRILILSRSANYYATRRLVAEARRQRHQAQVLDQLLCPIPVDVNITPQIKEYDVVIPRFGTNGLEYSLALLTQLRLQGIPTINSPESIAIAKNKFKCLQVLAKSGVPVPPTVMLRSTANLPRIIKQLGGLPVIIKLLKGSQGTGVMLGHSNAITASILKTVWALDYDAMLQKYITLPDSPAQDTRALVIGGKVIAAMRRTGRPGDFRSNIHCGAKAQQVSLSAFQKTIVIKAVRATGLDIAGVDIVESNNGPVVLEVNASPGFQGLEKVTGLNIAREIIRFAAHIVH